VGGKSRTLVLWCFGAWYLILGAGAAQSRKVYSFKDLLPEPNRTGAIAMCISSISQGLILRQKKRLPFFLYSSSPLSSSVLASIANSHPFTPYCFESLGTATKLSAKESFDFVFVVQAISKEDSCGISDA
jgi:hypothetical protein